MLDYRHRSALETARRVRAGETTAPAVLAEALDAARADAALGAFATLTPEFAAEQAASVDGALARGERLGPLAGVPVPIKDLAEVAGLPFEAGSAVLRGTLAQSTDAVAQRLIDAGSLTVGKTATPEFGFPPYTEPAGRPPAVTPWDRSRGAGGSSGERPPRWLPGSCRWRTPPMGAAASASRPPVAVSSGTSRRAGW